MPFLFPGLVGLAALAAVPIVIHLLNRRRYKRVAWAAMKFLRDALREEAKRIEYKDLLLMLLRALVCILLALAIARPITRMLAESVAGKRGVVLVLDSSASMGLSTGTQTLMDMAKREAISILRQMPPDTIIGLVDAARPATAVITRTRDLREAEKAIEEMEPSDAGTDIAGAVRLAADMFRDMDQTAGRDLFFFSDMQAAAWRAEADAVRKTTAGFPPDVKCFAVPVDGGAVRNLAVTALRIDPPVVAAQQPFAADVEVLNGGTEPEANVGVELRVDGSRVASSLIRSLDPGATARVRMLAEATAQGNRVVEAVVNQGRERFSADDSRRAVVRVAQGVQALLVDGEPGARFGEGEADYLDAVLAPEMEGGTTSPFLVTRVDAAALATKDLDDKDLVFLCNVTALRQEIAAQARTVVERGAGLVIFLGKNVAPASYNACATATPSQSDPLLPATIGKAFPAEAPPGSERKAEPMFLSADRLEHEWMAFFRANENRALLRVAFNRALTLGVATGTATRVVAWYENGTPAAVEKKLGQGRVVLFGTTADPEWNALFNEPLGPILISRIVSSILPGSDTPRAAVVGERVQLPLPAGERKMNIQLVTPGNKVLPVRPEVAGDRAFLVHDGCGKAGAYRYQIDAVPPREEVFVLNLPPDESAIQPLPATGLHGLFPTGEFKLIQDRGDAAAGTALRKSRLGRELWWPVLLAAFLLLVTEITFARLITSEAPSADDLPRQARIGRQRAAAGAALARGREAQ